MTVSAEPPIDDIVTIATSHLPDTRQAFTELMRSVRADDAAFTFFFYSRRYDPEIIAKELTPYGNRAIGGSSAGEIGPSGFSDGSMTAIALRRPHARAAVRAVPGLSDFSLMHVSGLANELARDLGHTPESLDPSRHIWVLLLDGLSGREDFFTPFFATHAPRLPLVGGSLGDGRTFEDVTMTLAGRALHGAGAVVLLEYDRPFEVIHHTHLEFTEHWFEVTDTEGGGRLLTGLDGLPAVQVYASALNLHPGELTMELAGGAPLGYRFKGRPFPCSVMRVREGRIQLAYSVQRGDRLNLLRSVSLVAKSRDALSAPIQKLRAAGTVPHGMLAFHCLGRYLEAERLGVVDELFGAMNQLPIAGLNTYGEQYRSRHMNHSLCGVLFG